MTTTTFQYITREKSVLFLLNLQVLCDKVTDVFHNRDYLFWNRKTKRNSIYPDKVVENTLW